MHEDIKVGDRLTRRRLLYDVLAVCGYMYAITSDIGHSFKWLSLTQLIDEGFTKYRP